MDKIENDKQIRFENNKQSNQVNFTYLYQHQTHGKRLINSLNFTNFKCSVDYMSRLNVHVQTRSVKSIK